jgi:2-oxoglutarate ferredoxin oxidoreductase subunit delta
MFRKILKFKEENMAKGKLLFDVDRCKGCGLCVAACPLKILDLDNKVVNVKGYNPVYEKIIDKCVACGSCAIMCPDSVIGIERIN